MSEHQDTLVFTAVVNDEEQYSIWPADRATPPGWTVVGEPGTRAECASYIERIWTDLRPRSLREALETA